MAVHFSRIVEPRRSLVLVLRGQGTRRILRVASHPARRSAGHWGGHFLVWTVPLVLHLFCCRRCVVRWLLVRLRPPSLVYLVHLGFGVHSLRYLFPSAGKRCRQ